MNGGLLMTVSQRYRVPVPSVFRFKVQTELSSITLAMAGVGTIDFGDGTSVLLDTEEHTRIDHTYDAEGVYTVTFTGMLTHIKFYRYVVEVLDRLPSTYTQLEDEDMEMFRRSPITHIREDFFWDCPHITSFAGCFRQSHLEEIPEDLFKYATAAKSFYACFSGCTVNEIPFRLFENCVNAESFDSCFEDCTGTGGITIQLFDTNTAVTNFSDCFSGWTSLVGYAPILWERPNVTDYELCFSGCTNLTNYADIPSDWK